MEQDDWHDYFKILAETTTWREDPAIAGAIDDAICPMIEECYMQHP